MSDVTEILSRIDQGDQQAADKLLPLVYDELRKLAAAKLVQEKPGQTLQAMALVHEAYLRLVGGSKGPRTKEPKNQKGTGDRGQETGNSARQWDSRVHFFAAAAEAMRRILTDAARRKLTIRHGGEAQRADLPLESIGGESIADPAETLAIHDVLDQLAANHPRKAEVVKLRYFVGCSQEEAAQILGITAEAAQTDWVFARAWLKREWRKGDAS